MEKDATPAALTQDTSMIRKVSNERHYRRRPPWDQGGRTLSIRGPVILFVIVLVLCLTLAVLWNVKLVNDYQTLRELTENVTLQWPFMLLGSVLFLTIIVLSISLGAQLINHIRWSQRQSNFIASVSHELNSPLSAIKLFAQTLRQPNMSVEDRLNFVAKILSDVERLKRLIANILRAAEVDNHGDVLPVVTQRIDLHGYLQEYLEDLATLRHDQNLEIRLEGEGEAWAMLDPMMFRQVLDNLVDNAIRYRGANKPHMTFSIQRRGNLVDVAVRDRGIGVPASELPSLFDRFYQVEDEKAHGSGRKGTGIGLFVVRSIILSHGGKVEARSAGSGRGTEIRICLPRAPATAARLNEGALELESHPVG